VEDDYGENVRWKEPLWLGPKVLASVGLGVLGRQSSIWDVLPAEPKAGFFHQMEAATGRESIIEPGLRIQDCQHALVQWYFLSYLSYTKLQGNRTWDPMPNLFSPTISSVYHSLMLTS